MKLAKRIAQLPAYLFADLDKKKQAAIARGMDVISLSIGDPDLPTPELIVRAAEKAVADPANHSYPAYAGSKAFREACAKWMERRFGHRFDADKEVLGLIGSKEGIAHLPLALVDPGDVVLCPQPGYPVYAIATRLVGGEVFEMPLLAKNGFLPDLDAIPTEVADKAKLLWINYPNNPTGAVAGLDFFERVVDFCRAHDIVLCSDNAYSEMCFDDYRAPSVFDVPGAREVAIEFHSMSKTYNMTGWRVGFLAGRADVVEPFRDLKSNLDSGPFSAVQVAAMEAMARGEALVPDLCEIYKGRRDVLVAGLRRAGFEPFVPQATFYVWMPVPGGDDQAFAGRLVDELGVIVTPGSGFGSAGAGYVRFSLTVDEARLEEAVKRIESLSA
ncbi:MAG: LL-diaminopimelate aminotransferase [Deltaproteobacteria bacterium]|nr:LL-diaminopimelate aminotransferase [Deltaproteobacteria bacterium]